MWDLVLYRSATDAEFRELLLRDPATTLREQGVISADESVIVHEWRADQHILVLPPPAEQVPSRLQPSTQTDPALLTTDAQERRPYSDRPTSPSISGAVATPFVTVHP